MFCCGMYDSWYKRAGRGHTIFQLDFFAAWYLYHHKRGCNLQIHRVTKQVFGIVLRGLVGVCGVLLLLYIHSVRWLLLLS